MGMTTLTGTLTCATPAEAELVQTYLPEHIRLSRAESGCLKFEVTPSNEFMVWTLDEAFVDADAFKAHQTRTESTIWAEQTAHIARNFKRIDHA
ncbi:putative quinol monooxygenase [Pseudorhodobacter sp.]|uniref:putative quinol monooxygenase n=1 Tax=Pseudorhodobacter sp. TaxID=1934400 RepID=UPI002648A654|nr:antibiotic biosynthesis monooxygenase [Pseudorhodobacter sp.]MDN5786312.1 antibiotic biosynthesis monooxygenase [Pseudorhodobacter sp.]